MSQSDHLARKALRAALSLRIKLRKQVDEPICVFDFAEELGVPVRFMAGGSFEGMYCRQSNTIMVPSQRPPGRQAFACAHELGHWFFKHGTQVDIVKGDDSGCKRKSPDERLADSFAAFLLMPSKAVAKAFSLRGWASSFCTPAQAYIVANHLGVGYETVLYHVKYSLDLISDDHFEYLKKVPLKEIRRTVLGVTISDPTHLVIADKAWSKHSPIDLQVGDAAIIPSRSKVDGKSVEFMKEIPSGTIVVAKEPGISTVMTDDDSWAAFVRVSRKEFVGMSIYRHLEEADDD